jgi:uncharacterized protein (DUF1684 family)
MRLHVIRRGSRHAVRVKDPQSPARQGFRGLAYYPIDPAWRVRARFERFDAPREVTIADVQGGTTTLRAPGRLVFTLDGTERALTPLLEDAQDTELWLIWRDETNDRETYGAGRYLYATLEGDGAVVDFNKAYNPPCAFTAHATCPLPPRENRLDLRIEAGEKRYIF